MQTIKPKRKRRVAAPKRKLRQLERAQIKLIELQASIASQLPENMRPKLPDVGHTGKTVKQMAEEFLSNHPRWAKATLKSAEDSLNHFLIFVKQQPFNRDTVERWVRDLFARQGMSDSTKAKVGSLIAKFCRWCWETKRTPDNFHAGLQVPKAQVRSEREPYTKEEAERLIAGAAGTRNLRYFLLLAFNTGMAKVDCCDLTWGQVDLENCCIRRARQKTKTQSIIPFAYEGALHNALLEMKADAEHKNNFLPGSPVCPSLWQNYQSPPTLLKNLCRKLGIKYRSSHSFRAGLIKDMMDKDVSMLTAMKITGHKDAKTFLEYATPNVENMRSAIAQVR